jgi:hypothetical protein
MPRRRREPERCDWPKCSCLRNIHRWQRTLARWADEPASKAELAWAVEDIRSILQCVTRYCPDADDRRWAQLQLCYPVYWRKPGEPEPTPPVE